MRKFEALPFAAALLLAAAAPAAAKDVADIAITPASADALPGYKTAWRMPIQSYDPAAEKMVSGAPYGGVEALAGRPKSFVDGFLDLQSVTLSPPSSVWALDRTLAPGVSFAAVIPRAP